MIDINEPSIAILIDFWARSDKKKGQNLLNFLNDSKSNSIETVVLASYNCYEEKNTVWHQNYYYIFNGGMKGTRTLIDLHFMQKFFNDYYRPHDLEHTAPEILNYVNPNKFQIAMLWGWEFEYYLSKNPHIKNVYVFGQAWEICVKIRPLGYEALLEIPNINILTKLDCIRIESGKMPPDLNLDPNWYHVVDDIYCHKR
jgi:hypothetical protein